MWAHHHPLSATLQIRGFSDALSAAENVGRRVHNFRVTTERTLRSIPPPVEFAPRNALGDDGIVTVTDYGTDPLLGIFHARLAEHGSRDILLAHFAGHIWVMDGFNGPFAGLWRQLIGPGGAAQFQVDLPASGLHGGFLTQFERIPTGILITPQGSRSYVYDGDNVVPLGYATRPAPPEGLGPSDGLAADATTTNEEDTANTTGYAYSGRELDPVFGDARLGDLRVDAVDVTDSSRKSNPLGGILLPGEWRAAAQWINIHGDLSPLSGLSAPVTCSRQENLTKDKKRDEAEAVSKLRIQAAWSGIQPGPPGTVGRIVPRTKNLQGIAGDPHLYELPGFATAAASRFATVPDNVSEVLPDNVPDTWLRLRATVVDAVPLFKLSALSMGRLWVANAVGDPGLLRYSLPNQWGTFAPEGVIYPDNSGAEVTGLFAVPEGLMVFTATSTFLVTVNDSGNGFIARPLSRQVGCSSPNSVKALPDGTVVWLSRQGFFVYTPDGGVQDASAAIRNTVRTFNRQLIGRATAAVDTDMSEYRCWVPKDACSTENDLCMVFDGNVWRTRDDLLAADVCITNDARAYMLVLGKAAVTSPAVSPTVTSVFCADHDAVWTNELPFASTSPPVVGDEVPVTPTAVLETHWLRTTRSQHRASPERFHFWIRETRNARIHVEVMADHRDYPVRQEVLSTDPAAPDMKHTADPSIYYGQTNLGGVFHYEMVKNRRGKALVAPAAMRNRRPFWQKFDVEIPSSEVFKVRFTVTGDFEFIGMSYLENPVPKHGGASMEGGRT